MGMLMGKLFFTRMVHAANRGGTVLFLLFSFFFINASSASTSAHEISEVYLNSLLEALRPHYSDIIQDLNTEFGPNQILGIRTHSTPYEVDAIESRENSLWRKLTGRSAIFRPSKDNLQLVRSKVFEVWTSLEMYQHVGWNKYQWSEYNFVVFENLLLKEIDEKIKEFDASVNLFHEMHAAPFAHEVRALYELYLDIWMISAILKVETDRFLSAFYWGAHRNFHENRQSLSVSQLADCRVALIRMSNWEYRW
jgi:hypothetical protein